jgi:hypothetical protein
VIRWENGWGGLGRYERIFLVKVHGFQEKKSVRICPIRPIRSPIVSQSIIHHSSLLLIIIVIKLLFKITIQFIFEPTTNHL